MTTEQSRLKLSNYQRTVSAKELQADDLRLLLDQLLRRLNLQIVREQTPDYTAYELQERKP